MTPDEQNLWNKLCDRAAKERDPSKITELLTEILRMLHEDQERAPQKNAS
jgi:hypothetical protein